MSIKKGSKLHVRVDYRTGEEKITNKDITDHLAYVENAAKERYFVGGGFSNTDGGMCLFEAKDSKDAQKFAENDPLVERGFYRYELFVWDIMVLSEDIAHS